MVKTEEYEMLSNIKTQDFIEEEAIYVGIGRFDVNSRLHRLVYFLFT